MADFDLVVGQNQTFAYEDVLACLGNDVGLLCTLAVIYEEDYPTLLQEIEQGSKGKAHVKVHESAHKLRGLVSNFRDQKLDKLLEIVERNSQSGIWTDLDRIVNEIRQRCRWLSQELQQIVEKS